jgi:hypothetical protein
MAQLVYPHARDAFARGEIDWPDDDFLVILTRPAYTLNPAHEFRDDVTNVLATASLSGMTIVGNGVLDADDCSVSGVTAAESVGRVLIAHDTGDAATDRLLWATDIHTDGTNILRVSDGNPIVVAWDNGPYRIFQV